MKTRRREDTALCFKRSVASTIVLMAVSSPIEWLVPGQLFEMVAGTTTIGIARAGYFALLSGLAKLLVAANASQPPITTKPSSFNRWIAAAQEARPPGTSSGRS